MNRTLYINGVAHKAEPGDEVTYVDHPDLPGWCCACHRIGKHEWLSMESGSRIYTGGNWYSLHPDREASDHPG